VTSDRCDMASRSDARQANIERCRVLIERGVTAMNIARELGVALSSIYRYRQALGMMGNRSRSVRKKRKRVREPHWTDNARSIERDTLNLNYYTTEATEFLRAIEAFRSKHRRIPTLAEAFGIAVKDLGYRKDATQ